MSLETPGHVYVQSRLREMRDGGEVNSIEDSQAALRKAWKEWKEVQQLYGDEKGRVPAMLNPAMYSRTPPSIYYPGCKCPVCHGSERTPRMLNPANPKMPVGYYAKADPHTARVVVREYVRKLPKRKGIPSEEKPYHRLNRDKAKIVETTWEKKGSEALAFERASGGGPYKLTPRKHHNPVPGNPVWQLAEHSYEPQWNTAYGRGSVIARVPIEYNGLNNGRLSFNPESSKVNLRHILLGSIALAVWVVVSRTAVKS